MTPAPLRPAHVLLWPVSLLARDVSLMPASVAVISTESFSISHFTAFDAILQSMENMTQI